MPDPVTPNDPSESPDDTPRVVGKAHPTPADLAAVVAVGIGAFAANSLLPECWFGGGSNRDQSLAARTPKPHRKFPVPSRKGKR